MHIYYTHLHASGEEGVKLTEVPCQGEDSYVE